MEGLGNETNFMERNQKPNHSKKILGCTLLIFKLFNDNTSSEKNGFYMMWNVSKLVDLMAWTHGNVFCFASCQHQ
jgi:hypothetical protein